MFNIIKKEINWGGKTLSLETGKIARQANSVVVKFGETTVLCTVVVDKKEITGIDFVPLTVNFLEKAYATGHIPGGFMKREAKPSDEATLTSRLIDRPVRPLLPSNFRNDTQIICTLLSLDNDCSFEVAAMIGASAALTISEAPFAGPLASAKVGYIDGKYVLNPSIEEFEKSELNLSVAGTKDSVLMVESEAKELSEDVMLSAVSFGHKEYQAVIKLINDFASNIKVKKIVPTEEDFSKLEKGITDLAKSEIESAYAIKDKAERRGKLDILKDKVIEKFAIDAEDVLKNKIDEIFTELEKKIVRGNLLNKGIRIDGRKTAEVRPIQAEVDVLPKVHGSALFTRGETQAIVIATLGSGKDEQMIDGVNSEMYKEKEHQGEEKLDMVN